jgi:hypothetical protein
MKTAANFCRNQLIFSCLSLLVGGGASVSRAEDITTKSGTTYTGAMVTGHSGGYLEILHDAGGAKIHFEDLSEDYQKKYQYSPFRVWFTDYKMASKIVEKSDRPMLILIAGSDWEVALPKGARPDPKKPPVNKTQQLKSAVLDTNRFTKYAEQKLVLFEADMPKTKAQPPEIRKQNADLAAKFEVAEPPAVFLLNVDGDQIGEVVYSEKGGIDEFMATLENLVLSTEPQPGSSAATTPEDQKVAQGAPTNTPSPSPAMPAEKKEQAPAPAP